MIGELIGTDEKRWHCDHCGRAFALKSYLSKHLEQQHGEELVEVEGRSASEEMALLAPMLPSLCEEDKDK